MRLAPLALLALALAPAHGQEAPYPLAPLGPYGRELVQTALSLQMHTEWVSAVGEGGETNQQAVRRALGPPNGWKMIGTLMQADPYLQAYVATRGTDLVVAFRGTWGDNGRQAAVNFFLTDTRSIVPRKVDFLPEGEGEGARVHNGFLRGYALLRDGVRARVATVLAREPETHIYVTGHSLGGALATLAALDLDYRHGGGVQLVATGCPRVGNGAFAELVERRLPRLLRVSVIHDPVPGVPWGAKYQHAGRLLVLNDEGDRVDPE